MYAPEDVLYQPLSLMSVQHQFTMYRLQEIQLDMPLEIISFTYMEAHHHHPCTTYLDT